MNSLNISHNNKRIAKNTLFLYLRSIVIMGIGIFTSRVVLQTLGVEDYGIYNIVGGFVAMFAIISSSLVHASQRFISYEMGKDHPQMNRIFCATVSVHLLMALFVFFLFESVGIWFLNTQLNISTERLHAANWVFQCSVLAFCVNLISIPYNACIIAHEKMSVFAYIGIYEASAKLGIVYILWLLGSDRLIAYALLMLVISLSLRLIYGIYCSKHFEECHFHFLIDKPLFKEMLAFSGWNFIGSTAGILSNQGINILINIFFGVTLNAARGIAEQANHAITMFVSNFMTAVNPQITKSHASGDFKYMNTLMYRGSKYSALLYWFFGLTFFVESDYILKIWLVEVPAFAVEFLRLTVIYSMFLALSNTLYIGMLATGNIKNYQIIMGGILIFGVICCYFAFYLGFGPEWSYISMIIVAFISLFIRLFLLEKMIIGFSMRDYFNEVIYRVGIVIVISSVIVYLLIKVTGCYDGMRFVVVALSNFFVIPTLIYLLSLDTTERMFICNRIETLKKRLWQ